MTALRVAHIQLRQLDCGMLLFHEQAKGKGASRQR